MDIIVFNSGVTQPLDKGIVLKDILETGAYIDKDKSYCIDANSHKGASLEQYQTKQIVFTENYLQWDASGKGHKSQDQRAYWPSKKHGALAASRTESKCKVMTHDDNEIILNKEPLNYRKLSPLECERLQTLPTWEIKIEIKLCLEQLKNYVSVATKNLKLQKLAGNAENSQLIEFVLFANKGILVNHQLIESTVQGLVDIKIEQQTLLCIKGKCPENQSNASNVPNAKSNQHQSQESFVVPSVSINLTQENNPVHGKVGAPQKGNNSIVQKNGLSVLKLSGNEIEQLVNYVSNSLNTYQNNNFTSTTLSRLGTQNIEQILIILYFYAKNAIGGYTVEGTEPNCLSLTYKCPYTQCEGVSNTQRYKMLGNGWTVDVLAHIFRGMV